MFILFIYFLFVFAVFSVLYLFAFHLPLFKSKKIFFYRGAYLLGISTALCLVFLIVAQRVWMIESYIIFMLVVAVISSAAIHLMVLVVFPVTFDRSVTMFLLRDLYKHSSKYKDATKKTLTFKQLEKHLINEYILKNKAVKRRIYEQSVGGLIKKNKNRIYLTKKGILFLKISKYIERLYNIPKTNVYS